MESLRITLHPLSAFGSRPLGDMLFGQLCWAVRNRYGEATLTELLDGYTQGKPWAVVSDALPSGFLPRPSLPAHWFGETKDADRKAVKKRAWLPIDRFHEPIAAWLNYCKPASELAGSLPEAHPQPHNTINRATGTTGEGQFAPYAMTQLWFGEPSKQTQSEVPPDPTLNVYIILDETRLSQEALGELFEDIGLFGFGRDASIGLGKFEVISLEKFEMPLQSGADAWLTLAPSAPQGQGFDAERSYYQVFTRFGRHGDIGVHFGKPFKTPVLLAQTGAVFSPRPAGAGQRVRAFIGQGLGGNGSLSKSISETVHQGYAPVVAIRLPPPRGSTETSDGHMGVAS